MKKLNNENLHGLKIGGFSPKQDLYAGSIHPSNKFDGFLEFLNKFKYILYGVILLSIALFLLVKFRGGDTGIIFRTDSYVCEFDYNSTKIIAHVSGDNVKIEMLEDDSSENVMMVMDNTMYLWEKGSNEGFAYPFKLVGDENKFGLPNAKDYIDMLEEHKENCNNTVVDNDVFTLPKEVKFNNLEELTKDLSYEIYTKNI